MISPVIAGWIIWIAWYLGDVTLGLWGLRQQGSYRGPVISITLGFWEICLTVFGLGYLHLLYPVVLWGFSGLITLTAIPRFSAGKAQLYAFIKTVKTHFSTRSFHIPAIFLFTTIFLNLLSTLTPELRQDALQYHVTVPHIYLLHGIIFDIPNLMYHFYSMNQEMLYLLAQALDGDYTAKILHAFMSILSAWAVYGITRESFPKPSRTPWLAASVFFMLPQVAWMSMTTYHENGWMLAGMSGILAWFSWRESQDIRYLGLAGLLAGMGIAIKIISVIYAPFILGLATTIVLFKNRSSLKIWVSSLSLYSLCIILPLLPWLIRHWIYTRNPIFPLFGDKLPLYPDYQAAANGFSSLRHMNPLMSIPDFINHSLTVFSGIAINGNYMLMLFAGSVLAVPFLWKQVGSKVRFLMFFSITAWILYLYMEGGLDGRFIYPIYPVMAAASISILSAGIRKPQLSSLKINHYADWFCLVLFSLFLFGKWGVHQDMHDSLYPLLTQNSIKRELKSELPLYPAMEYINQNTPKDSMVLMPTNYSARYLDRPFYSGSEFEPSPMQLLRSKNQKAEDLQTKLEEWQINYIVVRKMDPDQNKSTVWIQWLKLHGKIVHSDNQYWVVQVISST